MKLNSRKIRTFLLVLLAILIPVSLLCYFTRGTSYWTYLLAVLYMPMPAVAAIITQKFIFHEPVRDLGFKKINLKWFFLYPVLTSLLMFTTILTGSYILGNLLHIPGFGFVANDALAIINNIAPGTVIPEGTAMPPILVLLPLTFVSSIVAGFTLNGLFALGEELGWRGFLVNELKPLGFFKSNLIIGLIWGFWHAPIILMGYNYPQNPILGVFAMNFVTIPLGFILTIGRIKSNTVLTSAVGHGMFNGFAALTVYILIGANIFVGTGLGIWGFVASSILAFLLYLLNKEAIQEWYSNK